MGNEKRTMIISGCGFRNAVDMDGDSLLFNIFDNDNVKINIGTAIAFAFAEAGYDLILISKTDRKLKAIRQSLLETFPDAYIEIAAFDLLSEESVKQFVKSLSARKEYNYIHSAGISSGAYQLKDDNPYLSIDETPLDLPSIEFEAVVKSLLNMVKNLLPLFKNQDETRIVVVSSMSSVRSVPFGFSHTSAKAGLHNATRSMSLELNKANIYVSEVMPGAVDTGMYDNEVVKKRIIEMGKMFGYEYDDIPMMPPSSVAEAVRMCVESKSHILAINMVAQGQWPNLSS